ncbi:ABC transporter substrate-binding protein [Aureitalea sp. L0-47]|uniref:substrate-binding domain-containing protein n=1 Tax=Aureitalea sp. L0-47 TaxID=2816962 RepID=UPI00223860DF|nr:substrate-binding domain-containing protein [Aureitalea sp. L0-47]MCW5519373.1 ABC transporter substrate-binding protein [Aureitalea sp. L0-47]
MKNFHIGGVPEHFNLPWYLTLRDKSYTKKGINLRWKDYYGGTGAMAKALREKEIDMAVILTEGIIRDICNGNDCSVVQIFVQSPLVWGIHVAKNSEFQTVEELKGKTAAISRFGSGSHLMAYVNAENLGWDAEKDLDFEVIANLEGALKGLPEGNGDYFMWEKFTTKPYVDHGPFRRVGECPTPWPCFVIAVRNDVLENDLDSVKTILDIINETTADFKNIPSIDRMIANRYNQELEDVREWLSITEWSQENLNASQVQRIQETLLHLELIDSIVPPEKILFTF